MRIYLAGPMRGLPYDNKPAFHAATAELRKAGHFVFDPAENKTPEGGIRAALAIDTAWICLCAEAVAVLTGWEDSRGANAEVALARAIGIQVEHWMVFAPLTVTEDRP